MSKQQTPAYQLQKAREREHVLAAVLVAQQQWRHVLELVESAGTADEAQVAVCDEFDLTWEQAAAVIDTQFRRLNKSDRDRMASELADLRAEITGLEADL